MVQSAAAGHLLQTELATLCATTRQMAQGLLQWSGLLAFAGCCLEWQAQAQGLRTHHDFEHQNDARENWVDACRIWAQDIEPDDKALLAA